MPDSKDDYQKGLELYANLSEPGFLAQGFAHFQRAAAQGNLDALNAVGVAQLFGLGTEADYSAGADKIKRAAEQGSAKARYNFARMLVTGIVVREDPKTAVSLLESAAKAGDQDSCYLLGKYYIKYTEDTQAAFRWFLKGAALGDRRCGAFMAYLSLVEAVEDSQPEMSLAALKEMAANGVSQAHYFLGVHYANHLAEGTNAVLSVEHLLKAEVPQCDMGVEEKLLAVVRQVSGGSDDEALHALVKHLEEAGGCTANHLLALIYASPVSKLQDEVKARALAEKGVELGCMAAHVALADLCLSVNEPAKADYPKAIENYLTAAERSGNSKLAGEALWKVATISAELPKMDGREVYQMASRAALLGELGACKLLVRLLDSGRTKQANPEVLSYAWARLGADEDPKARAAVEVEYKRRRMLTDDQLTEGLKMWQFFKISATRNAVIRGESSYRF